MDILQTVRNGILAIGACASLAAGSLGLAGNAEARINGPRNTNKAVICGFIQDAYDQDTADLDHAIDTDEYVAIISDRDIWIQEWHNQGCDTLYGSLFALAPATPAQSAPITAGGSAPITAGGARR